MLCRGAMTQSRLRGWQIGVHEYISIDRLACVGGAGVGVWEGDDATGLRKSEKREGGGEGTHSLSLLTSLPNVPATKAMNTYT